MVACCEAAGLPISCTPVYQPASSTTSLFKVIQSIRIRSSLQICFNNESPTNATQNIKMNNEMNIIILFFVIEKNDMHKNVPFPGSNQGRYNYAACTVTTWLPKCSNFLMFNLFTEYNHYGCGIYILYTSVCSAATCAVYLFVTTVITCC